MGDIGTYKSVDIHPVRVGLSTGCTLYFKRIEIGGVWGVEGEEVRYAVCIVCVSEGVEKRSEVKRTSRTGGNVPCKVCC